MATQAAKGAAFLEAGKYVEAIEEYTAALAQSPTAPDYYIKRSIAYQRKNPADFKAALQDAEYAVVAATARARRELMAQAQLRRGIALFGLDRYADAGFVFGVVKGLDPKEKTVGIWEAKIQQKLKALEEGDEKAKVTVKKDPDVTLPEPRTVTAKPAIAATKSESKKPAATTSTTVAAVKPTPADKIKHDWYQSAEKVYLTLLAKGVPKDEASIEILPYSVSISFPTFDGKTYAFSLDPLYGEIDPASSTSTITKTKVEIVLKKVATNSWAKLESDTAPQNIPVTTESSVANEAIKKAVIGASTAPAYPTSSRSGPKNWDKLADEMADENEGGDDVNHFFQSLYKGADPETQRAMLKSYQESNGTVLSTNWSDVGKGKVETAPPDGMVAKKWGE
jgi:suppressor of G2 allele of SKP1